MNQSTAYHSQVIKASVFTAQIFMLRASTQCQIMRY